MDILKSLWNEINLDPIRMGYDGKKNNEIANLLNEPTRTIDRKELKPRQLLEAFDDEEIITLSVANLLILQMYIYNEVDLSNTNVRKVLKKILNGKTKTIQALQALQTEQVSRAFELGLPRIKGTNVKRAKEVFGS